MMKLWLIGISKTLLQDSGVTWSTSFAGANDRGAMDGSLLSTAASWTRHQDSAALEITGRNH